MADPKPPELSPRSIALRKKYLRALELRELGWKQAEIAEELGYASISGVQHAIWSALQLVVIEPIEELRKIHHERLETLLRGVWPMAAAGDPVALQLAIRLLSEEARLWGLNTPVRVDLEVEVRRIAEHAGVDPTRAFDVARRVVQALPPPAGAS